MAARQELHILVFGAHPDDCDVKAGGVGAKYVQQGYYVRFVSLTNGDAGHHEIGGIELAQRRRAEAEAAGRVIGVDYQVLDNHDGELLPTLEHRRQVIRIIREVQPDLIMAPRPNDYHPDHRYTSQLVQDAAYMVTVPNIVTLTEHLRRNPVIVYVSDSFRKPYPFTPDVAVGIDDVIEQKLDMLHCHTSQMYEWLPYNAGMLEHVPQAERERRAWLAERRLPGFQSIADRYRDLLIKLYGHERGRRIQYAEAFEACEYGSALTPEHIPVLFPFFD